MCMFPLLFLLFFFYCYGHHRDLHSFPTRRSSDLCGRVAKVRDAEGSVVELSLGNVFGQDRKSTRLNSSHVRISYAVFCLKKKKKQPRRGGCPADPPSTGRPPMVRWSCSRPPPPSR